MSSPLKQNTTTIQELLNTINNLPEAENLDTELNMQDDLISQIQTALQGKASGSGGSTPNIPDSGDSVPNVEAQYIGITGFAESTAEGSIIYAHGSSGNGSSSIETVVANLTYLSYTKKYRYALSTSLIANTPIIILTSGTITMPPSDNGYTATLITSGSGYAVYKYTK